MPPKPLPPWPGPIAGLFLWLLLAAAVFLLYMLVVVIRTLLSEGF